MEGGRGKGEGRPFSILHSPQGGDWDVEVVYTGLGPGEKLCEELFREGERVGATKHEQIFIAEADDFDGERLREGVVELERLAREMDEQGIRWKRCPFDRLRTSPEPASSRACRGIEGLREIVPEYELADSLWQIADG